MLSRVSIHTKVLLSFILLVGVISVVFTVSSYFRITNTLNSEYQKHGVELIKTFSHLVAPYIFESDYVTIMDSADRLIKDSDAISLITITDLNGQAWLSTNTSLAAFSVSDPFYNDIIENNTIGHRKVRLNGQTNIEFVSPISAFGKVIYLVKMKMSLDGIEKEATKRINEAIIICTGMIFIASLVALLFSKLLTGPLEKLVLGTNEITQGNFTYRVNVTSSDEIGNLSKSFNLMTDHLEKELSQRKHAEEKLREHRDNLEKLVLKRTAQLTQANEELSEEIDVRKKTARALKEREERYKRLSEVTVEGIVFHNKDGILDCNATFEKLFDYTLDELKGKNLIDSICPPENRETVFKDFTTLHHDTRYETMGRRQDGVFFPIELQSRGGDLDIEGIRVTSIRDITEQKKLEAQLSQAKRLESIGLMASGVAHDLNNILSGIVGYPELLLQDLPKDSEMRKPLQAILQSGERAATVVTDLLTVARGAAIVREVHNLNPIIQEYLDSPECVKLKSLYPQITYLQQFESSQTCALCSSVHVKKCLMNLMTNASEAIVDDGTVFVSTHNQHIDNAANAKLNLKAGEYVVLSVQDTGPGISTADLAHIYEPFYTRKVMGRSGTGLGLTVVWNTMKDHDGKIFVESNDKGTCFQLYFPLSKEEEIIQPKNNKAEKLTGNNEHILVVDDEPQLLDIAGQMLRSLGYKVDVVDSGKSAIEFIKGTIVDLIVLDMLMEPGINGRQTYEQIIKLHPGQKAIVASGFSESNDVKAVLKLGAGGLLKKPYSKGQLGRVVKEALRS